MKIKLTIKLFLLYIFFITTYNFPKGVVCIKKYSGLLGNQLYQFCLGKILAKKLNFELHCPPIFGFPKTYKYMQPTNAYPKLPIQKFSGHIIPFNKICTNKTKRIIILDGAFIRYEYYKNFKNEIKKWLQFESPLLPHNNQNDIVMHVRIQSDRSDMHLPPSYYEAALSQTQFDKLYICTNEPNHPYIKQFEKYNPIIKSTISLDNLLKQGLPFSDIIKRTIEEFKFIMSFNKIITAQSTFSWWAAFLSNATEIFAPLPDKGIMSPKRPDVQMTGIEEKRYIYIPCKV